MNNINHSVESESLTAVNEQPANEMDSPSDAVALARSFDIITPTGELRHFDIAQEIRAAILAGELPRLSTIGGTALPNAKPGLTLEEWAKANEAMRVLYEPVWSHTLKGALYGGLIVAALKLLDTFVGIARVNGEAALLFAIVMAFMGSPKYKPQIAFVGFMLWKNSKLPFSVLSTFLGVPLGVLLFAAVFGISSGMAIGTIVGYIRRAHLQTAPDAIAEGSKPAAWGLAVPASAFVAGGALYIYVVMPWLVQSLGK